MKTKKAQVSGKMVAVVMMVVVVIILIIFIRKPGDAAEGIGMNIACRQTIKQLSNLKVVGGELTDAMGYSVDIPCPPRFIETTKKGEILNQEVADQSYACYTTWDEPRLFDTSLGNYCVPCTIFSFHGAKQLEGFVDYLKEKKAPTDTKLNYLASFGGAQLLDSGAEKLYNFYDIDKDIPVAIVITHGEKVQGQYLIYDNDKKVGMLFYPFDDDISELGCYSFGGSAAGIKGTG